MNLNLCGWTRSWPEEKHEILSQDSGLRSEIWNMNLQNNKNILSDPKKILNWNDSFSILLIFVTFQVLTAASMKMTAFWDIV
jgi:hypothetical protein